MEDGHEWQRERGNPQKIDSNNNIYITMNKIFLFLIFWGTNFCKAEIYAQECHVSKDGKETCLENVKASRIETQQKKVDSIISPEQIPFEEGGLMVSTAEKNDCTNSLDTCETMEDGWCDPQFGLRERCRLRCGLCKPAVVDKDAKKTTIGVRQENSGMEEQKEATTRVLTEMVRYLREEVLVEPGYDDMYRECKNHHELCAFWAGLYSDECSKNPDYMLQNCILACKKCSEHPKYVWR